MKIALITGSCGLVGSESSFFSKKGFKIFGIDNNFQESFFLVKMVISLGFKKT